MIFRKLDMEFSNINKAESAVQFTYNGAVYRVIVGVSPVSKKVLVTLNSGKEQVIQNVVAVDSECIVSKHSGFEITKLVDIDLCFISDLGGSRFGNVVKANELGSTSFLYLITGD
ncbi:MAG: hypothetical protein ACRC6E_03340 [Fusobacteriaceae bacterium]